MSENRYIHLPPGRIISGSLYDAVTNPEKPEAAPLYKFGVAIPKEGEATFFDTEWGQEMWNIACEDFDQATANRKSFSWKVTDGDSTEANSNGNVPCEQPHYAGNWIVWISSQFPGQIVTVMNGGVKALTEPGAIKRGYWVEVQIACRGNTQRQKPGIYVSQSITCLVGYDEEIQSREVDPSTVGFGKRALPSHVKRSPVPTAQHQRPAAPTPATRHRHAAPAPQRAAPPAPQRAAPPAPARRIAVAKPELVLTVAAMQEGYTLDSFAGWADDEVIAEGWAMKLKATDPAAQFTLAELEQSAEELLEQGIAVVV